MLVANKLHINPFYLLVFDSSLLIWTTTVCRYTMSQMSQ